VVVLASFRARRTSANPTGQRLDVGKVGVGALIDRLESSGFVASTGRSGRPPRQAASLSPSRRAVSGKARKETDKFNAQIAHGIDRKALEATSDALLAMKRNLLAMSDGSTLRATAKRTSGRRASLARRESSVTSAHFTARARDRTSPSPRRRVAHAVNPSFPH